MPSNHDKVEYYDVFKRACKTGLTRILGQRISQGKFQVNESLFKVAGSGEDFPLLVAIRKGSIPVVTLLLENGADPNPQIQKSENFEPLLEAICYANQDEIVKLLLYYGAKLTPKVLRELFHYPKPDKSGVFDLVLRHMIKLLKNPKCNLNKAFQKLGKWACLIQAMLINNEAQVTELLRIGDYEDYAGVLGDYKRPSCFDFWTSRIKFKTIEIFINLEIDLHHIYLISARMGDVRKIELCASKPQFDPHVRDRRGQNALHMACRGNNLNEIFQILVNQYGVNYEARDNSGQTPIFNLYNTWEICNVLNDFPEIDLNIQRNNGDTLLIKHKAHCEIYSILLKLGANPKEPQSCLHDCPYYDDTEDDEYDGETCQECPVFQHVHKMWLVDPEYVQDIASEALGMSPLKLEQLKNFCKLFNNLRKDEITRMKEIRISQGTTTVPAKNLFDFLFFTANEAARYSRNEVVLNIYETNSRGFWFQFYGYGMLLDCKLKKGQIRRARMESAMELLCYALGTGLPDDFAELIFGHLSNSQLQQYSLDSTENST